jgi:hypothetical protein
VWRGEETEERELTCFTAMIKPILKTSTIISTRYPLPSSMIMARMGWMTVTARWQRIEWGICNIKRTQENRGSVISDEAPLVPSHANTRRWRADLRRGSWAFRDGKESEGEWETDETEWVTKRPASHRSVVQEVGLVQLVGLSLVSLSIQWLLVRDIPVRDTLFLYPVTSRETERDRQRELESDRDRETDRQETERDKEIKRVRSAHQ